MSDVKTKCEQNSRQSGVMLAEVVFTAIIAGVFLSPAAAETLTDPTQPPGVSAQLGPDSSSASAAVLQSVMLKSGKKSAMISGQVIAVGEKFGDATLLQVTDQSALLLLEDGTKQVLEMHPAVVKKVNVGKAVTKKSANKQKAQ